ncbi:zinc finger, CCHC-type containing protein [Tanacetum coccineum]
MGIIKKETRWRRESATSTRALRLGKTLDESLLVLKLLDSTPDRFIQIVASIEQTSDLDDVSLDEITGKLKAFEERIKLRKGGQVREPENLLLHMGTLGGKGRRFNQDPLDLVYGDLVVYKSSHTSGKKLIFLLVDDCTRFMWAYFLTSKDQAFSTFKEFRQKIEMEMRMKVRMLRTDRGGEFTSNEFTKYCKENGIARQLTAPYSPQQNGVVERRNRTVLSTTRSMMKAMKLPLNFWAEAVRHAIYILNRLHKTERSGLQSSKQVILQDLKDTEYEESNDTKIPMDPDTLLYTRPDSSLCSLVDALLCRIHARPEGDSPEGSKASNPIYKRIKGAWHNIQERRRLSRSQVTATVVTISLRSRKKELGIVFYFGDSACQAIWLNDYLVILTGWEEEREWDTYNVNTSAENYKEDILTKSSPRLKLLGLCDKCSGVQDLGEAHVHRLRRENVDA